MLLTLIKGEHTVCEVKKSHKSYKGEAQLLAALYKISKKQPCPIGKQICYLLNIIFINLGLYLCDNKITIYDLLKKTWQKVEFSMLSLSQVVQALALVNQLMDQFSLKLESE